jgi:16S rRNA (cytosine967-C5)-methyltransferase
LIDRWLQRWEPPQVRRLVEANNRRPSINLTPLGTTPNQAIQQLTAAGIEAEEVGAGTGSVRLGAGAKASRALDVIPDAIVQDPAAYLVSRYADIPPGTIVADLCAAPGGKALALMDRPARIVAADRSESRIHMVRENAHRTGRRVQLVVADALHPPFSDMDAVLIDVPCTGTGTLSRHPDARWRLSEESIDELARLQEGMLASAASVVAPGGLLVYSTCTLEPEENEERIGAFLKAHQDFQMASTDAVPADHRDLLGCLSVRPQDTGFDGAFAARMRRAG